jgi:endo-1,4-beta-xylanase
MTLKNFPFHVGFAIKEELLGRTAYTNKFISDATSLSGENAFNMGKIQEVEGTFDFTTTDAIMDFAEANGLRVHGHTLIWANDQSVPNWVLAHEGAPDAVEKLTYILTHHITEVVKKYKGRIKSWDVVNETTYPDGANAGQFRDSVWSRVLGMDFFRLAFATAAAADPDCRLFYNDVNLETGNLNSFNVIMGFKNTLDAAGVPFHGVGFQMHTNIDQNRDIIRKRLKLYAENHFLVHISELDVVTNWGGRGALYTERIENDLAKFYSDIFEDYMKSVPDHLKWGITMWSVSDRENYMNIDSPEDYPMLFNYDYNPKLAYYRVLAVLGKTIGTPLIFQDFEVQPSSGIPDIINSDTGGTTPKTWTLEGSNLTAKIELDETGLSGAQTNQNTFNYPVFNAGISDYELESETGRITSDTYLNRVMYLMFRYSGTSNWLAVHAQSPDGTNAWRLIKRDGITDTVLIQTTIKPVSGQVIKVICNGSYISLYIDGVFIGKVQETQYQTATKIGYRMRGYDDKFSSWKFIKVSSLPPVFDEFKAGVRSNLNGTSTNGGILPKIWAVTSTGSGNDGMEVATFGLKAVSGSSARYNLATINSGFYNFTMTARLLQTKLEYSTPGCAMMVFRVLNVSNFLTLRVSDSATDRRWMLMRRVNDNNFTLLTSPFDAKNGDVVRVVANGPTISVYINDYFMGDATDTNFQTQTKVGFRGRGAIDDYSAWGNMQIDSI